MELERDELQVGVSNRRIGHQVNMMSQYGIELELELVQTQMTPKPMLQAEVGMRGVAQTEQVRSDSVSMVCG